MRPQELALVRRSHVGFTGFELAAFSVWLESPDFPFNFQLPVTKARPGTNSAPARSGVPAARGSNNTPQARPASPATPPKR